MINALTTINFVSNTFTVIGAVLTVWGILWMMWDKHAILPAPMLVTGGGLLVLGWLIS